MRRLGPGALSASRKCVLMDITRGHIFAYIPGQSVPPEQYGVIWLSPGAFVFHTFFVMTHDANLNTGVTHQVIVV